MAFEQKTAQADKEAAVAEKKADAPVQAAVSDVSELKGQMTQLLAIVQEQQKKIEQHEVERRAWADLDRPVKTLEIHAKTGKQTNGFDVQLSGPWTTEDARQLKVAIRMHLQQERVRGLQRGNRAKTAHRGGAPMPDFNESLDGGD